MPLLGQALLSKLKVSVLILPPGYYFNVLLQLNQFPHPTSCQLNPYAPFLSLSLINPIIWDTYNPPTESYNGPIKVDLKNPQIYIN